MNVRVIISILMIFLGFFNVECRRCFIPHSVISSAAFRECPKSRPKCCGTRRDTCAVSCENLKCVADGDCDGLACCSSHCSSNQNCWHITTWGVVGISIVSLSILLVLLRTCKWWRKRKNATQDISRISSEGHMHRNSEPPFVLSADFENRGYTATMAPPSYENAVQNTGFNTDNNPPPLYNLNLQTFVNDSSTNVNDSGRNNFAVNISIRGSTMFNNDFPPSYSEINNSGDNGDQPPSYGSSQGVENLDDEPPPYSLDEGRPNSPGNESRSNTFQTDLNIPEDSSSTNATLEYTATEMMDNSPENR